MRALGLGSRQRRIRERQERLQRAIADHGLDDHERRKLETHVRYAAKHGHGSARKLGLWLVALLGLVVGYAGLSSVGGQSGNPGYARVVLTVLAAGLVGWAYYEYRRTRRGNRIERLLRQQPRALVGLSPTEVRGSTGARLHPSEADVPVERPGRGQYDPHRERNRHQHAVRRYQKRNGGDETVRREATEDTSRN